MFKKILLAASTLIMSVSASAAINLGTVTLGEFTERDTQILPKCRYSYNKPVKKLKLVVKRRAAEINRLRVVFHNGGTQVLNVRKHFKRNSQSRWIDLRGYKRCIKKIIVVGDADTPRFAPFQYSVVRIYGK